eukprot:TRINITY_DN28322_c0_g1_i1.p1 TRINITY_DN28322_c0_g1~~TRINITY_DN28322_c0_g1_i1.p1  ORF type:complete len:253 (+),score=71.77 TRINITY_DN28322_c0_g1_i1:198-956(+)
MCIRDSQRRVRGRWCGWMKRYRREIAESDEDSDMDEDERAALKAFKTDGFDKDIAGREAVRLEKLDKEAEAKQAAEEAAEEAKRAEEARFESARRAMQVAEEEAMREMAEKREAMRANSPGRRVVFIGNLGGASIMDLESHFNAYGSIVDVHMPKSKSDIGFVEYSASFEAMEAVDKANGRELLGRTMRVNLAKPRANVTADSDKMPGGAMTQAERIATYGVGGGYISYSAEFKSKDKKSGFVSGDQRYKLG